MNKIIKFSKSYENIFKLKKDFYDSNKINLKNSVSLNSFIDLLSKKFKKRSQINTFLDREKLFRYQ